MENTKNSVLIIGLLTLILGLMIGYFAGTSSNRYSGMVNKYEKQANKKSDTSGMHGAMRGMTMDLDDKSGDELDLAFLDGMIIHHEGAVEMAKTLIKDTKRPELIKLGNDIITAQTGEIQMMKEWRIEWFDQ